MFQHVGFNFDKALTTQVSPSFIDTACTMGNRVPRQNQNFHMSYVLFKKKKLPLQPAPCKNSCLRFWRTRSWPICFWQLTMTKLTRLTNGANSKSSSNKDVHQRESNGSSLGCTLSINKFVWVIFDSKATNKKSLSNLCSIMFSCNWSPLNHSCQMWKVWWGEERVPHYAHGYDFMQVIAKYDMQDPSGPEDMPRTAHAKDGYGLHRLACSMPEKHQGSCSKPCGFAWDPWDQIKIKHLTTPIKLSNALPLVMTPSSGVIYHANSLIIISWMCN